MDIETSTSLQDRINALNMNQMVQQSPRKKIEDKTKERNAEILAPTPKAFPRKSMRKSSPSEDIKEIKRVWKQGDASPTDSDLEAVYSMNPSNVPIGETPVAKKRSSLEIKGIMDKNETINSVTSSLGGELSVGDDTTYSSVPRNTPISDVNESEIANPVFMISTELSSKVEVQKNEESGQSLAPEIPRESTHEFFRDQDEPDADSGVYQSPRSFKKNIEVEGGQHPIYITCKQAEELTSRWQVIRRTVKDPGMRQMIDMSELQSQPVTSHSTLSDVTINSPDTYRDVEVPPLSPNAYKRSHSLADSLFPLETRGSEMKRPSLPVAISIQADLPPVNMVSDDYSPESPFSPAKVSRQSSSNSNISEAGRARNLSDVSNMLNDVIRTRHASDVSVTYEENNYIAFGSLSDSSDNLSQGERTLVVVKGDTSYSSKMQLDDSDQSSPSNTKKGRDLSASTDDLTSGGKRGKNKKFKVFGKLTKAMKGKNKVSSSASSLVSPTSMTMPPRQFPQSQSMTSLSTIVTSPTRQSPNNAFPKLRPISNVMPEQISSVSGRSPRLSLPLLEEGVYYDPSQPDLCDNGELCGINNNENDDVLRVEYDVDNDVCDVKPLTPNERSQSLASLSHIVMESIGKNRKMSDHHFRNESETFEYKAVEAEPVYLVGSPVPIPPPKPKSDRRKAERKLTQSDTSSMNDGLTSQRSDSTLENGDVLRMRKPNNNTEGKSSTEARPGSMPGEIPPRPPSMPLDEPPVPTTVVEDENEYVAATAQHDRSNFTTMPPIIPPFSANSKTTRKPMTPPLKSSHDKPPPLLPRISLRKKNAPNNQTKTEIPKQVQEPPSPTTDGPIYHTVPETEIGVRQHDVTKEKSRTQNSQAPKFTRPSMIPSQTRITSIRNGQQIYHSNEVNAGSVSADITAKDDNEDPPKLLPRQPITPRPKPPGKPVMPKHFTPKEVEKPATNDKPAVRPPPRPSKLNKHTSKPISPTQTTIAFSASQNTKPITQAPNFPPSSASSLLPGINKTHHQESANSKADTRENPSIAELGKLISVNLPANQTNIPQSPKTQRSDLDTPLLSPGPKLPNKPAPYSSKTLPHRPEPSISQSNAMAGKLRKPPATPPPTYKQSNKRPSVTSSIQPLIPSSTSPASPDHRSVNPVAMLIHQRNEALSNSTESPTSPSAPNGRTATRRPPAKKPTGPPPPRPNVPPPPRPDALSQPLKMPPGEKAPPPRRPPPPSSDKIKAAERRRISSNTTETNTVEEEYNDTQFKHIEEINPYSAIDEEPLDDVMEKNKGDKRQNPPSRAKQGLKLKSTQSFNVIANMKNKLGRQKKAPREERRSTSHQTVAQGTYNDGEEERVYAGIDDFNFPPNDFIMPKNDQTSYGDEFDDEFDSD